MKSVSGFLTSDGVFFHNEEQAKLYEANKNLKYSLQTSLWSAVIDFQHLTAFVNTHLNIIAEYIEASKNVQNLQPPTIEDEASSETDRSGIGRDDPASDNAAMPHTYLSDQ